MSKEMNNDFEKFSDTTYNDENKSFNYEVTFDMFYTYYFTVAPTFDALKFSVHDPHRIEKGNLELICSVSSFRNDPIVFIECLSRSFRDRFTMDKTGLQQWLLQFIQYVENKTDHF